jgi:CRP/FNR family transcriptional regulator, nitrogen oxide reductase regulator
MEPGDLDDILKEARSSRYPKDMTIFAQEEEAHSFFLLLNGHIRVVKTTSDGDQVIARYIREGELFGIAAAIGRTTYPANAIAAVDCVALAWPIHHWHDFATRYPSFTAGTYATVGKRLQETQDRVVEMSTEQVEQRVTHALLRLIKQAGRKTEAGIEIDFKPLAEACLLRMNSVIPVEREPSEKYAIQGSLLCGRSEPVIAVNSTC